MVPQSGSLLDSSLAEAFVERRAKPRVTCSYPSTLRGHLPNGMRYQARAVLANLSASGMYLRTRRRLQMGETLFVVVRLSTGSLDQRKVPRLAAYGEVLRIEHKADGTNGVALRLNQHRFF